MADYTVKMYDLISQGFDFGLESYPIFDEDHRDELNIKLIEHYYEYEIGSETPALFKFKLNRAMNEIMPYFNQLYESERLKIDPLKTFKRSKSESINKNGEVIKDQDVKDIQNVDTTTDAETNIQNVSLDTQTNEAESIKKGENLRNDRSNSSTDKDTLNVESDTPQTEITIGDIENNLYASKAMKNIDGVEASESSSGETIEESTSKDSALNVVNSNTSNDTKGKTISNTGVEINTELDDKTTSVENQNGITDEEGYEVSQAELLNLYRSTFLSIDEDVINHPKVKKCFMLVYT